MSDVIELPTRGDAGGNMPVTQDDADSLKRQRELLKKFVKSQLKKGVDYGVIPGTDKPSLWKPGAEKLARLFGMGIRVTMTDKEISRHENFALFNYKCEMYLLRHSGIVIAECEASCNSQEKKYKERFAKKENGARVKEETPIFDILNTLQKMAQKRAMVGAVILAVSGSDFFTQDIEDPEDLAQLGIDQKPATQRVTANVPGVKSATSQDQSAGVVPTCCGRPMMESKFNAKELYCVLCKTVKPKA